VKRIFTRLAAMATFGAVIALTPAAHADGTAQPRAQRIVIVNIAKVLRDYDKANERGTEITKRREAYVNQVQGKRTKLADLNKQFTMAQNPDVKKQFQEQALLVQREIEDIDRTAQAELTKLSNETIVDVYKEIKGVIFDIAKTNNLDMVLCYPAATKPEDENSPQVAQLMLQTPALIPFYHSQMDITHVVVETLNKRYPGLPKTDVRTTGGSGGSTLPPAPPK
jgi:Skp family chaperone for outer membrane proteins